MAMELLVANRVIATKVDAEYVQSHAITTDNLDAIKAEIQELIVDEIDGKYADIHLANIDILDVGQFFADSGLVKDMTIVDGKVTGVLDSVTINANSITSGTLTTDRLVIRGTDKSIVYELNNIDGALQAKDVDTLNGEIITPRTINADRIIAESITANELATESITSDKIVAGAITAEKLAVDAIMSNNYVADATGSFLNLEDGSFDSKYLKWDEYGKATITDLKVLNSLDVGSGGVYADYIGRPTQWYMRANKYTGGFTSDIILIGFERWDSLDNPTEVIDDTVVMSVYGGYDYGVEFPIVVNAKKLKLYQMEAYEERDRETGAILSRSGSIGTNSGRFPEAFIEEIKCNNLNVDGSYQSGQGNIDARGYIQTQSELISKGTLTVEKEAYLQGNTTVKGQLVANQGMYVHDTGYNNWGTAGYIVLARLEVKGNWLSNEQIRFKVKGLSHYGEIIITFSNQEETLATTVNRCTRSGNLPHVYYSRTVGSNSVTIDIIVEKQQYQEFVIENYVAGYETARVKMNITFPNTFESTLRSGAVAATQGTDYFQNVDVVGNINTNDVIVGYGTTGQSSVLRLAKGIVKGGAGSDYLMRVTEMNLNFSSGVATVDMTPYLAGSSFEKFVLAQMRQAQSTIVTAARIEGTTLYVQATALSGTPYTGGAWVNVLFLMNI
jgi:cytoskeletal protein CcmA (bactofilin family)